MKKPQLTLLLASALVVASIASFAGEEITKTNLSATITVNVSTNVVSGDNATSCNMCFDNGHWKGIVPAVANLPPCKPYHPATETLDNN